MYLALGTAVEHERNHSRPQTPVIGYLFALSCARDSSAARGRLVSKRGKQTRCAGAKGLGLRQCKGEPVRGCTQRLRPAGRVLGAGLGACWLPAGRVLGAGLNAARREASSGPEAGKASKKRARLEGSALSCPPGRAKSQFQAYLGRMKVRVGPYASKAT